jgi:hypothetical protein
MLSGNLPDETNPAIVVLYSPGPTPKMGFEKNISSAAFHIKRRNPIEVVVTPEKNSERSVNIWVILV